MTLPLVQLFNPDFCGFRDWIGRVVFFGFGGFKIALKT